MSWSGFRRGLTYVVFAATAFGLVLPGTLLSQLMMRWSLNDRQGGVLLAVLFLSSSAGALAARGDLAKTAGAGCVFSGAGMVLMSATAEWCYIAAAMLGLGLGATMTSLSLLQAKLHPESRAAEMSRLNLVWSAAACLVPTVLFNSARWSVAGVLQAGGAGFIALGTVTLMVLRNAARATQWERERTEEQAASLPLLAMLVCVAAMATGIESSLGGWLGTYSRRSGLMLHGTVSTLTCFWGGLLLGRLVQSSRRLGAGWNRRIFGTGPRVLTGAMVLLVTVRHGFTMSLAALLAGIAVGPMYPLAIALVLGLREDWNAVFVVSGLSSSLLPLATGVVSNHSGSLTLGLLVPLAAGVVMSVSAIAARRASQNRIL